MLIVSHHQNNKMNSMTTLAWCKHGNRSIELNLVLQSYTCSLVQIVFKNHTICFNLQAVSPYICSASANICRKQYGSGVFVTSELGICMTDDFRTVGMPISFMCTYGKFVICRSSQFYNTQRTRQPLWWGWNVWCFTIKEAICCASRKLPTEQI